MTGDGRRAMVELHKLVSLTVCCVPEAQVQIVEQTRLSDRVVFGKGGAGGKAGVRSQERRATDDERGEILRKTLLLLELVLHFHAAEELRENLGWSWIGPLRGSR